MQTRTLGCGKETGCEEARTTSLPDKVTLQRTGDLPSRISTEKRNNLLCPLVTLLLDLLLHPLSLFI